MRKKAVFAGLVAVTGAAVVLTDGVTARAALTGPVFPAALPAGPTAPTNNGVASVQPGGRTFTFSNIDTTQYSALFDAVDTGDVYIHNSLSNTNDVLTFIGASGGNAGWSGSTLYNDGLGNQYTLPVEFLATLGGGPAWGLPPVAGTDTTADLQVLTGTSASYTLNIQWLGKPTGAGGYEALSNIRNDSNLQTNFTNSFYYDSAVSSPEPASLSLLGLGAFGLIARRRRA